MFNRLKAILFGRDRTYDEVTADLIDEADGMYIQPQDPAQVALMPDGMISHPEEMYGERAEAQPPLHQAEGESRGRKATKTAAQSEFEAATSERLAAQEEELAKKACEALSSAEADLRPHARRGKTDLFIYYLAAVLLVLGDAVGISLPLIAYGEEIYLAVLQSVTAAVAMVASGMASGRAIKDTVVARHRVRIWPDGPPEHLEKYATRFRGDTTTPWWILGAAVLIGAVPLAILIVRSTVSGGGWGLAFGLLGVGVMAASFSMSYWSSDDVGDLLDGYHRAAHRAIRRVRRAAGSPVIGRHAEAVAEAASIRAEAGLRGTAAGHEVLALIPRVHAGNGHLFGVGRVKSPVSPPPVYIPAHPNGQEPVQP